MKKFSHAIVIGGSIAGLLTARILSDYFEQVTLIERDGFPDKPVFRKGVPQSHHLHLLLIRGKQIIESLFPGFSEDLRTSGAIEFDAGNDFLAITPFGRISNSPTEWRFLASSRVLTEWLIRQRVSGIPGVQMLEHTAVEGWITNPENDRILGVKIKPRGSDSGPAGLEAELVVDASGRNTHTPEWLSDMGYPAPPTTIVNSHLAYATRWYNAPEELPTDWKGIIMNVAPPENPRAAALLPVEAGRWVITLAGMAGVAPPTDETGFLEFARQLPDPIIYQLASKLDPISPIYGYRRAFNEWKHFEKMKRFPAGFAAIGDAVCAFNPIYGQGMTVAAISAVALGDALANTPGNTLPADFGLRFHRRLARVYDIPWQLATGEDFRWAQTEGKRPHLLTRISHWYTDQVLKLARTNKQAGLAFIETIHLINPPAAMLKPAIFFRAIAKGLFS